MANDRSEKGKSVQDLVELTSNPAGLRLTKGFRIGKDEDSKPQKLNEEEGCLHDNPADYFGIPEELRDPLFK